MLRIVILSQGDGKKPAEIPAPAEFVSRMEAANLKVELARTKQEILRLQFEVLQAEAAKAQNEAAAIQMEMAEKLKVNGDYRYDANGKRYVLIPPEKENAKESAKK